MNDVYNEGMWCLCYAVRRILLVWSTCPLREKGHCKSLQIISQCSPLSYNETYPDGSGIFQDDNTPIQKMSPVRQSPDLNQTERCWTNVLDSALHHHHHHHNTTSWNIF